MDTSFKYIKSFIRVFKIAALLIFSVMIILFSASLIMQDKVAGIILKTINKNISTKLEIESYRLSLIKKFPKASLEMKNVLVHSSSDFDHSHFKAINTDTLLTARSASIDFKLINLLKGDYTFSKITVKSGNLLLYTDTAGNCNYKITSKGKSGSDVFTLNLSRINLVDVRFTYNDLRAPLILKGLIKSSRIKSRIYGNDIDFDSDSEILLNLFHLKNITLNQTIPFNAVVNLKRNEKGIFFKKGNLKIDNWALSLNGFIASDNYLDLKVSGNNIDISKIVRYAPEKYRKLASEYNPAGILKLQSTIKGRSTRSINPHYEIICSLKNAHIEYSKSDLKINKFSFDGYYSNGKNNNAETSTFSIKNFITTLGSATYNGSFTVSDFTTPYAELIFKGALIPAELKEFLNFKNVESASGSVALSLKLSGYLEKKDQYRFADIFALDSQSEMVFNSFGIKLNNKNINIRDGNGKVVFAKNASTDDLRFTLNDQKIRLNGELTNLPDWIAGKPADLTATGNVFASCIRPESFMTAPTMTKGNKTGKAPLIFPNDIILNINLDIDTLIYKTFNARKIKGNLIYNPGLLNFKTFTMISQKGTVSGSGQVMQTPDKSFIGKGNFTVDDVDVNEAFKTFHNFGQDFLKSENIAGSLSGSFTLLLPVDSLLNPKMKSLTAEGKYMLTDGALIDFEPVKALSSFIEISELRDIKFDELENEFFIRNSFFYLPQMEVRSSAVNLSVNGKHNFDNYYQYHVKMLLSDLLSKKARKSKSLSTEFGEVEDDGLGRTSVFLKIEGKGKDVKVNYDIKAAGEKVKNDIKNEKQTLKTILNEEYGWYKNESEAGQKKPVKRKFRISWEGSDTTMTETESNDERKESIIKKLFKRNE